jgi:hypothetical protein
MLLISGAILIAIGLDGIEGCTSVCSKYSTLRCSSGFTSLIDIGDDLLTSRVLP